MNPEDMIKIAAEALADIAKNGAPAERISAATALFDIGLKAYNLGMCWPTEAK